jgi:hypothetical protein
MYAHLRIHGFSYLVPTILSQVHRLLLAWLADALKNGCLSFNTVIVDALPPLFYVGVDARSGDLVKEILYIGEESPDLNTSHCT